MKRLTTSLLSAALVLTIAGVAATSAPAAIRIVKIYYDSPGTDTRSNTSLNAEWIRLKNTGTTARYLTGWTIRDTASHVYRFGTFRLRAGYSVTVHTGHGTNTATNRYWGSSAYIWNNDKDTAKLKRPTGVLVDSCSYNSTAVDYKVC